MVRISILFIFSILVCLQAVVFPCTAKAQISVDNVIVHLALGSRPVHNVIVNNSSEQTAYVQVEVKEIPHPAENAGETIATDALLASPKAFSIEAKGQRTVRLLLKTPPQEQERVFRVGFVPQDRGFGEEFESVSSGRKTLIRVLTGMGILVFADPIKPRADLKWERSGENLIFKNDGTIHVYLGDLKSCSTPNLCEKLPSKRLYAGETYKISIPKENTVSLLRQEGPSGEYQKLTIDPKG